MLPPKPQLGSPRQRRLVKCFNTLNAAEQQTLLDFAEFLAQRDAEGEEDPAAAGLPLPKTITRPEQESVVAAIRRLSESFYMLEKDGLLHESSSLMTAHIMQGVPADDVVDQLEALFQKEYERIKAAQ